MKDYNGFSAKKRQEVHNWLKAEVEAGRVEWPKQCEACGQDQGIIDAHHEDYDKPLEFIGLCYTCHMMLHCRFRNPKAWERYKEAIRRGVRYRPVFRRDFNAVLPLLNGQEVEYSCRQPSILSVLDNILASTGQ